MKSFATVSLSLLLTGGFLAPAAPAAAAMKPAAQRAPSPPPAHPDFSGFWDGVRWRGALNDSYWNGPPPNPPPLTEWALGEVKAAKDRAVNGGAVSRQSATCLPKGLPNNMLHFLLPMDVLQRKDELVLIAEERSTPRHIYIDGRPHPPIEDITPSTNGHSIGHWEGRTLVVDTVGILETTTLTVDGIPHGPDTHIVERLTMLPNNEVFQDEITVVDPMTFTRPWTMRLYYMRSPPGTEAHEYLCIPATVAEANAKELGGAR